MAFAFRSLFPRRWATWLTRFASRGGLSSVRAKLIAMLVASSACLGLVALLGLMGLRSGEQATQRLMREGVGTVSRLGDLRAAFNGMARYEMDMLVNFESPPLTDAAKKSWWASYEAATAQIKPLGPELPEADAQRAIEGMSSGIARYRQGLEQLIPRLERGEVLSASVGNQLMIEHRKSYASAEASVAALQELVGQRVAGDAQAMTAQGRRLTAGLAGASAAGLAASLVIGLVILRGVQRQLGDALSLTRRIASGDLRDEPVPPQTGEIGSIVASLAQMRTELRAVASGLKSSATDVATASTETAQGSRDLSSRTEAAAALLQQLSSGLAQADELTASSAGDARTAATVAENVSDDARRAEEASAKAVLSMDAVASTVGRIAEITDAIKSLAFQTNLLALNAAVEAARAGEQGKGFGVVAQEVRGLAERAARAAGDIQELLLASRAGVENSSTAIQAAAQAVESVQSKAAELARLSRELVTRADHQTQSISTVSSRARQLDETGQRNSALAEQTFAAAATLQSQAVSQRALADKFQV